MGFKHCVDFLHFLPSYFSVFPDSDYKHITVYSTKICLTLSCYSESDTTKRDIFSQCFVRYQLTFSI